MRTESSCNRRWVWQSRRRSRYGRRFQIVTVQARPERSSADWSPAPRPRHPAIWICPDLSPGSSRSHPAASGIRRLRSRRRVRVRACEMSADHIIRHRQELSMLTGCAFDAWLFANTSHPLIRADRRVTRLSGRTTLEAARIYVLPPSKERAKECNFLFRAAIRDGRPLCLMSLSLQHAYEIRR